MNRRTARLILKSYPDAWLAQYGLEMEELLCHRPFQVRDLASVLWSGFGERMRQPLARFWSYSLAGSALTFLMCELLSEHLWRLLSTPVINVLRGQGARPGMMVQVTALEGMKVVRLGVPALITFFISFALMLILASIFSFKSKEPRRRTWIPTLSFGQPLLHTLGGVDYRSNYTAASSCCRLFCLAIPGKAEWCRSRQSLIGEGTETTSKLALHARFIRRVAL